MPDIPPRKRCCGLVEVTPGCCQFRAEGAENAEPLVLGIEELEAIRLRDIACLEQADCAQQMGLSRPTYQRLLQSARSKIAQALVEGRTILIQGGNYKMKNRVFECAQCSHQWEEAPCAEGGKHGYEIACPLCGSFTKFKVGDGAKHACGGTHHHGQGHKCECQGQ